MNNTFNNYGNMVNNFYEQMVSDTDFSEIINEMKLIKEHLQLTNDNNEKDIKLIDEVTELIKDGKKKEALSIIKSLGAKIYDVAKSIGCAVIAKVITSQMGI